MRSPPNSVIISPILLKKILDQAEQDCPNECCGLLSGSQLDDGIIVDAIYPSDNLAAKRTNSFELDSEFHIRIQRKVRQDGSQVVGVYHSHPMGSAHPSLRDIERAIEPELVWLIVGLRSVKSPQFGMYFPIKHNGVKQFKRISLLTENL